MFLLDTGAYGAMIDLDVAELLHLPLRGTKEIHGIHGYGQLQEYRAQLFLRTQDSEGHASMYMTAMDCAGVAPARATNATATDNHRYPGPAFSSLCPA
jgi:hypothetical protein